MHDKWLNMVNKSYLPELSRLFLFEQAIACLDLFQTDLRTIYSMVMVQ